MLLNQTWKSHPNKQATADFQFNHILKMFPRLFNEIVVRYSVARNWLKLCSCMLRQTHI
jgi:hypothetical protein